MVFICCNQHVTQWVECEGRYGSYNKDIEQKQQLGEILIARRTALPSTQQLQRFHLVPPKEPPTAPTLCYRVYSPPSLPHLLQADPSSAQSPYRSHPC